MNPEYQYLKLIIECPTRIAWDNVLSIFPKNNKGNELGTTPGFYMDWETNWDESYLRIIGGISESCGKLPTPLYDITHEHLTYPEFEARFLNNNDMKLKKENFAKEFNELIRKYNPLFGGIMNEIEETPKELEKKVWTVEAVYREIEPPYYAERGKYELTHINQREESFKDMLFNVPTEKSAQQVLAFCQLLTVAHWANEGSSSPNGGDYYSVHWSGNGFPAISVPNNHEHVLIFKSRYAYEKFASVHGVEDLLKTFFGIEEDAK